MGRYSLTSDQGYALSVLQQGYNVFLTGDAGTGKTALLDDFSAWIERHNMKILKTATTGVAAQLLGGMTIHKCVGWHPLINPDSLSALDYENKAKLLREADVLLVDEVSMLEPSFLRYFMGCLQYAPNLQIVFSGDFFQLPPVNSQQFAFETTEWNSLQLYPMLLSTVVRHRDIEFAQLLRRIRYGDRSAIEEINQRSSPIPIDGAICLCAHVAAANRINSDALLRLPGELVCCPAISTGKVDWRYTVLEETLCLKRNARIIFTMNDPQGRYVNGSLGTIIDFNYSISYRGYIDSIRVILDNSSRPFDINRVQIQTDTLECEEESIVLQFPIRLAYAITIHKAQGQTFSNINFMEAQCWECGQIYVALSRATSLKGIYLQEKLSPERLLVSEKVIKYYDQFKSLPGNR